jgi:hypothetical protein
MNPEVMTNTNAWPFIFAAYLAGMILTGGYTIWAVREKRRLQTMLQALREGKSVS